MEALAAVICVVSLASRPRRRLLSAAKTLSGGGGGFGGAWWAKGSWQWEAAGVVMGGSSLVTGSGFWVSKISWAFCETATAPPAEFSTWRVAGELVRSEEHTSELQSLRHGGLES